MVATDVSPEMIAIAREKAATEGVTKVSFEVAPAETPPATAGGFDAVLALNVLHLLDNRPALLRRMAEHLKPGGLLVSKTPCLGEMTPALRLLVPAMRLVGFAPRHVAFATEADLVAEMGDAGLTVIARERHGSGKRDPRVFIVARKGVDDAPHASGLLE
jgi:ubiquinone/menaquinone biosynthesis C-methylase UbiE